MCICCPKRSSRDTQILTRRSQSALEFGILPLGRLEMVIFTYSNILLSVSLINITNLCVSVQPEYGHLDCLKYLHETAKAPWNSEAVQKRTRTNISNVYNTPRQQLSITRWLAIRRWRVTQRGIRIRIRIKLNVITE